MSTANANIEAIYPLSYMQQGMLFHTLFAPKSEVYFDQASWSFQGEVNVAAFQQAWQQVVERHPILRTAFVWERRDKPLQVVRQQVALPWELLDWRGQTEVEQQPQRLDAFLLADRERGFDLSKPPLMRFALIRLADNLWHFAWSFHHILLDGWGSSLLLKEVFSFYEAYSQGQQLELARPRPYRDYIGWLQRQDMQQAEAYWRRRLKGFTSSTPLGIDRLTNTPEPESATYAERSVDVSEQTCRALETLARQQQVTLNTIVQGAWALLLARYSGQSDVLFGVTVSGRPAELAGVEQMVGLFINTLPVRIEAGGEAEVGQWLQQLQGEQAEMRQYEYSPLVEVQGWSEAGKGLPLFESILVFENYPVPKLGRENGQNGSASVPEIRRFQLTNYPITVRVGVGKKWSIGITYDTRRFESPSIIKTLGHVSVILGEMAAHPRRLLSEMSLLTKGERQQLLVDWNQTQQEFPGEVCVHQLFEAQAARTPAATALIFEDQSLTYADLNRRANQLAHHLRSLGVGPETLVSIYMQRSVAMIVGLLAILKAGGAYLALDQEHPRKRVSLMLADSTARFLLTQHELLETLAGHGLQTICIDADWSLIAGRSVENPNVRVEPHHLAYMIYTSGTTGKPKAVMVEHANLSNSLLASRSTFGLAADEAIPCMASFSFDISLFELMSPLMVGGRSLLLARGHLLELERFCHLLEGATFLHALPVLMGQFLSYVKEGALAGRYRLRKLFVGGDLVSSELMQQMAEVFPGAERYTGYGPTEGTIMCTNYKLARGEQMVGHVIGRPMANMKVRLYDGQGQLVPVGVCGELYLGGRGVARGYLNAEELTREKFVEMGGERYYRTGDVARYREDGELEFVGRADQQVKVRGYRVELGEVEAVISEHVGVEQCTVIAREDTPGNQRLVAYIVARQEPRPTARELRAEVAEKLPSYMIPSAFAFLEQLPLTDNGKVDRKRLPAPDTSAVDDEGEYVQPRTPVEELLSGIWAEVLKVPQVGAHDNFFELGGHSLLATQVISRIRHSFQLEVPLRAIFEAPTIAALGARVEAEMKAAHGVSVPAIVRVSREEDLPLSFAQQRLWFLEQLDPFTATYNMPAVTRLSGPLRIALCEQALREIIRRHESLRTRFVSEQGRARQEICEPSPFHLPVVDLSDLPVEQREVEVRRLAVAEAQEPFDLLNAPLLRVKVLRMEENDHVVFFTMHHIIGDGWSTTVLTRELGILYDAFSRGEASPLPELQIQYADFAAWQRDWLQGEVLERQLNYWRKQLADVPQVLKLPTDRVRPAVQSFRGAAEPTALDKGLAERVRALSRSEGSTMYMCLLAAFHALLARYTGQTDIVTGTPIANRNRGEIEGLIGFFVNTLVLRSSVDGEVTMRQMIGRVREVCLNAYAHQDVPFEQLVEELQPERDLSRQPLFQVMFILQNLPKEVATSTGWKMLPLEVESRTAKFDLSFFWAEADELSGTIEYSTDLFDPPTIVRLIGHFRTLLESAVANPDRKLADLPLLTEGEQQQLLFKWSGAGTDYAPGGSLPQLFEAQAQSHPAAVALSFNDEQITYDELNRRANQLAHHLQGLGVVPDSLVALVMERSLEMVVAVLGILKAGGAYVPLDPAYPRERLAFMLADAGARVLVTQEKMFELLPETDASVVRLDADWNSIAQESEFNPVNELTPENLAYVIYTSGSTGQPKGVLICHDNVIRLFKATDDWFGFDERDVWTLFHSYAFDFSVWEIWGALLYGGRLVVVPHWISRSPDTFSQFLRTEKVTVLNQTPSAFRQLMHADETPESSEPLSLRWIIFGGEALELESLRPWFRRHGDEAPQLVNMYGITETTVHVTYRPLVLADLDNAGKSVIGSPLPDLQIYLLDRNLQPVPVGVSGEMYVGGGGLARSYLNRPEITAERFIPNCFSSKPGERLYKTGDLARWLGTGDLEYLGRIDHQVKVRGFRIELGEIEAALRQHPALRDALVLAREDVPGDKRLVAYLVPASRQHAPEEENLGTQWSADQVSEWQAVFDETYGQPSPQPDSTFNIIGWNSSYTGQPIPAEEMLVWVDQTVDRITALRPKSVLEIGCGTGLLMFRIAPLCESYCGTDFSEVTLRQLQQQLLSDAGGPLSHVILQHKEAADFEALPAGSFDGIVINSVAQYFPGINYLLRVLENAVMAVRRGGFIFIGDVRSLPLLETFHASVQLFQAADSLSKTQLQERIKRHLSEEEELVIDPAFFTDLKGHLPQIGRVEIQLKRGHHHDELTKFRYDVILHIGDEDESAQPMQWLDWQQDGLTLTAIRESLADAGTEALAIRGVPNARLHSDIKLMEMLADSNAQEKVGELRQALQLAGSDGEEPESFWALGDEFSVEISLGWSAHGRDGCFDVVLRREAQEAQLKGVTERAESLPPEASGVVAWETFANDPLQGKWMRNLVSRLRAYASGKLPDYMIPSSFVIMDAFPLTPNGKLDRQALPAPDGARPQGEGEYVQPRTPVEEILANIWVDVLRLERVGVNDNFFELGGDSILSIQAIARAKEAGLYLTPKDLFQNQTIAKLAAVAKSTSIIDAEQGVVTGTVELTSIQQWFFEQEIVDVHHFNQSMLLQVHRRIEPSVLLGAAQHLLLHHDALRLRYLQTPTGWQQFHASADEEVCFTSLDLSALPRNQQAAAITAAASDSQTSLSLATGPLLRFLFFDLGPTQPARLLIVSHHLVVDGVSWRILLEDLQLAYSQLLAGEAVQLAAKTTSFRHWAETLKEYAASPSVLEQAEYWLSAGRQQVCALPRDELRGENQISSTQVVSVALSGEETRALLQEVPAVYHTQVNDLLLTALALALTKWMGSERVLIDMEGHGREQVSPRVDVSRTVGWFTSIYPVLLEVGGHGGRVREEQVGEELKSIKEQLREIPEQGIGYGLLRYMSGNQQVREQLESLPQAEVIFNYLGQVDRVLGESGAFGVAPEFGGSQRSSQGTREHLLEINSMVAAGRLQLSWTYSQHVHRRESIEEVAAQYIKALQQIIHHCQSEGAGGYTPSDFPLAQLTQAQLDRVMAERRGVEDLYPLSPMQQGMLFHSLYAPDSQVYFNQLSSPINGELDAGNVKRAWQQVVDNHAVLRTGFLWSGLKQPLQIVHQQVELPWEQHDWREFLDEKRRVKLDQFLKADRERGFDLSKPPLMRVALIQMSDGEWQVVWSHHHLLMDGWCMPLILKEFGTIYDALQAERSVPVSLNRPFRDYIAWLQRQDMATAEGFWRETLKGFESPTMLDTYQSFDEQARQAIGHGEQSLKLSEEATARLDSVTRKYQLTLNTLVQGAWGLLLSRYSGEQDVLFGAIVSGRPTELEGVEGMLGVFINALPVRVGVDGEQMVLNWLKQLQAQQVEARQYDYAPLVMIQGWSDVPRGLPLFESILAFENYPVNAPMGNRSKASSLEMPEVKLFQITNYPLSLMAWPAGSRLALQLGYDSRFDRATITRMLSHLERLLENFLTTPAQRVCDLSLLTDSEQRLLLVEWNDTATNMPDDLCLQKPFETQAARTPEQIALVFEDERITYRELNQRANRLAHYLQSLGVGPETLVNLFLERSIECVVAMFAVLKAGGAFVPLDTEHPRERLSFMIADSAAPLLLTQGWLSDKLPEHTGRTLLLDVERDVIAEQSAENPKACVTPASLAYLIYTSGTSGKPKAVMVEHRNLIKILLAVQSEFGFTEQDVVPCIASFSFDISLLELLSPLLAGGSSILLGKQDVLDLERFSSILQRVTFFHLTPGLMRQLVNYLKSRTVLPDVSRVRQIFTGGDLVPLDLLPDVSEVFPHARLFIGYGPTEGTIISTGYHVPKAISPKKHLIGRPLGDVTIRLYDRHRQLVPIGVAGELYLGGAGVARGYLHSPELTAEKFVVIEGERFYRTGDMVRYLEDGNLEFLGRADQQVKIRGYRIEVEEIENVLSEHARVRECVVAAREDTPGEKRLVAYIVPARGKSKTVGAASGEGAALKNEDVQLWPSIGEYFVYDELIYYGLTNDEPRNQSYQVAIRKAVRDKVVVEIGTGRDAILARLCIEAGAKKVYAIEILEESFKAAKKRIETLGLADRVVLLHGDAAQISLPEKADVCVSEIVDAIGGAEGAATILNSTRRLLKEDAVIIPARSVTQIAAVSCPDELLHHPCFTEVSAHYVEQIFAEVGHKFDLRLAVKNFPAANIISSSGIFEDLDFRGEVQAEFSHQVSLVINRNSRLNGFLLWLNLHLVEGEVIDILDGRYSWFPVYFPVFHPGIEVTAGDRIEALCRATLCENRVTPGYTLEGSLIKRDGETLHFSYDSFHHRQHYRHTPFYEQLFSADSIPVLEPEPPGPHDNDLKDHLRKYLPEYMVPSAFVILERLPLTPNGKVDRRALPAPEGGGRTPIRNYVAPRNATELKLREIWEEILNVRPIGITDNFFEIGGHSLLALRLVGEIQKEFMMEMPLSSVMTDGTIKGLARFIEQNAELKPWSPLVAIQTDGNRLPFYCVHAGGGNVLGFYDLSHSLGPKQPFYGLQAYGLIEGQEPYTSIEEMAACYVKAIRAAQPEGPYHLGGYSSGGIIAFEMAQQLRRQGHEVGLVAMLDCFRMSGEREREEGDDARLISIFARTLGRILPVDELRQIEPGKQIDYALEQGKQAKLIGSFVEEQQLLKTFYLLKALKKANRVYKPEMYPGTVTLFRPVASTTEIRQNIKRLSRITDGFAILLASLLLLACGFSLLGLLPWIVIPALAVLLLTASFILGLMASQDALRLPATHFQGLARSKPPRAVGAGIYYLWALRQDRKGNFDLGTDLTLGWGEVSAKPVEVHEVPGDHLSIILKPDVQALADNLNNCFSTFNKE